MAPVLQAVYNIILQAAVFLFDSSCSRTVACYLFHSTERDMEQIYFKMQFFDIIEWLKIVVFARSWCTHLLKKQKTFIFAMDLRYRKPRSGHCFSSYHGRYEVEKGRQV